MAVFEDSNSAFLDVRADTWKTDVEFEVKKKNLLYFNGRAYMIATNIATNIKRQFFLGS